MTNVEIIATLTRVDVVAPVTAVISLVLPEAASCGAVTDLRATFCDLSNYFCSAEEAAAWAPSNRRAVVLSIMEAVQVGHRLVEWLLPQREFGLVRADMSPGQRGQRPGERE